MYGFIVDVSSTLPFMAFSQGDTYVFRYSFLFFSFAKAAALVLSAAVEIQPYKNRSCQKKAG